MYNDILRLKGIVKNQVQIGPKRLEVEIITSCNINCLFCWFHSPLVKKKIRNWQLEIDKFQQIANDAKTININHIYITGRGEPCLHPHLPKILECLREKGFYITLTTNLATQSKKILSSLFLVDTLEITLCASSKDKYKKLQCSLSKNLFDRVLKNISIINKLAYLKKRPKIRINYILTKMNTNDIDSFIKLAEDVGIHEVRFSPFSFVSETKSLCLEKKILDECNKRIAFLAKNTEIKMDNSWKNLNDIQIRRCYMGWFTMLVGIFGRVRIGCFDSPFSEEGNIYKNSLKEIWFSNKAQETRLKLKNSFEKFSFCPFYNIQLKQKGIYCPFALENKQIELFIKKLKRHIQQRSATPE